MIDIFDSQVNLFSLVCHSGGAPGSDTYWEEIGKEYGILTKAYSYKTKNHQSDNKVEISDADYKEGVIEINKANKWLNRYSIHKYMNLLARNWAQVKYSNQVFAIGRILKPKERGGKGYYNKGKYDVVDGGTGYACQMCINHNKELFVYDQVKLSWFRWSYSSISFVKMENTPIIKSQNFAGIGTREITINGINAIRDVYEKTFNQ